VLYGPEHHHPTHFSVIVKEDKSTVSIKLPVAVVLINVAFAVGHLALVNLIFGLPYLQSTGAIVDLNDKVVVMSNVGHAHFPIEYYVSQCSVPLIVSSKIQHARDTRYKGIRAELNETKAQV
jgi:hypothetical protein